MNIRIGGTAKAIAEQKIQAQLTGGITLEDVRTMTELEGLIWWRKQPGIGRKVLKEISHILGVTAEFGPCYGGIEGCNVHRK